jgi:molybdenum cofactor cytidylyltransferase
MRFGPVPVGDALGAILAHSTRLDDGVLKKGRVLGADDVARLARAGHETVVAARLEGEDVPEDQAAERLARVLAGDGASMRSTRSMRHSRLPRWRRSRRFRRGR